MEVLEVYVNGLGLWVWCLTPLSTIFKLYRGGQSKNVTVVLFMRECTGTEDLP